jgi:hypothetical protein
MNVDVRFVVMRNGTVFQYCETLKRARRVVRIEKVISKILSVPVRLEIIKEEELRQHQHQRASEH